MSSYQFTNPVFTKSSDYHHTIITSNPTGRPTTGDAYADNEDSGSEIYYESDLGWSGLEEDDPSWYPRLTETHNPDEQKDNSRHRSTMRQGADLNMEYESRVVHAMDQRFMNTPRADAQAAADGQENLDGMVQNMELTLGILRDKSESLQKCVNQAFDQMKRLKAEIVRQHSVPRRGWDANAPVQTTTSGIPDSGIFNFIINVNRKDEVLIPAQPWQAHDGKHQEFVVSMEDELREHQYMLEKCRRDRRTLESQLQVQPKATVFLAGPSQGSQDFSEPFPPWKKHHVHVTLKNISERAIQYRYYMQGDHKVNGTETLPPNFIRQPPEKFFMGEQYIFELRVGRSGPRFQKSFQTDMDWDLSSYFT